MIVDVFGFRLLTFIMPGIKCCGKKEKNMFKNGGTMWKTVIWEGKSSLHMYWWSVALCYEMKFLTIKPKIHLLK